MEIDEHELQKRLLKKIESMGLSPSKISKGEDPNPFPLGNTYIYNISKGKFDKIGIRSFLILKDYLDSTDNK